MAGVGVAGWGRWSGSCGTSWGWWRRGSRESLVSSALLASFHPMGLCLLLVRAQPRDIFYAAELETPRAERVADVARSHGR